MARQPSLTLTEKRVFHAFWQDGLLDVVAGATIAGIGLGWLCGVFVPMVALPIVGVFAWQSARRRVTEPRMGSVAFSTQRRHRLVHGLIAIFSLGVVVGGNLVTRVWFGRTHSALAQWFAPAIPVTIVAAMSLSCAAALGLWRFLLYGIILFLVGLGLAGADLEPWWGLIAGGAVIAICGAVMLAAFLRDFPILPSETED